MFDKLIESEPEGADFRSRSKFFVTSSLVVGVLFLAAVVISIFAADYSLKSGDLDIAELLAPVDMAAPDPEPPAPQPQRQAQVTKDQTPSRQVNMLRPDEEPLAVVPPVSTAKNTQLSRPPGEFKLGVDSQPLGDPSARGSDAGSGPPSSLGSDQTAAESQPVELPPPPPVKAPEPERPVSHAPVSKGVLNGSAIYLPKPSYSAAAQAIGAQGTVQVQILIDESGHVVSAKAVSGHMLLRPAAEAAARNAKFSPTTLSEVPVKVTGIITYNFMRG